jgi:flagellar protein FliO/FliZ
MSQLTAIFGENKPLLYASLALAALVAAFILLFLYRLVFRRRRRLPGSARGRQPRLGIVDAFILDAERELVIIRRDNVEHLLMLGGPNDVVIETQIVRAQPATHVPVRDKEPAG